MNHTPQSNSEHDLNASVDQFENEWRDSGRARVEDFLPPAEDQLYLPILSELIRVDLEIRWRKGEQPRVEDYLRRFSDSQFSAAEIEPLAFEEYRLRFQANAIISREEFAQRFAIDTRDWPTGWSPSDPPLPLGNIERRISDLANLALIEFPDVGTSFHGFEIVGQLGQGAFGRVYLAREESLANRFVALKVTEVSDAEPQSLAKLQHTNIVPIYSLRKEATLQSICMPFLGVATLRDLFQLTSQNHCSDLSGKDLISTVAGKRASTIAATVSKRNTLALNDVISRVDRRGESLSAIAGLSYPQTALWMIGRVANGLAYAHARGVIHGDLKPANILISDDGEPLILDFHLAHDGAESRTESLIGGTLPYMSACHLRCWNGENKLDKSCDVFSLGVVLYESLTGFLPFENRGSNDLAIEMMIHDRQSWPIPIRRHNPQLTVDMESIVNHCLAPEPSAGYHSAGELQTDIERHLANLPLQYAPNRSWVERARKWNKRHPRLSSGTTIGLLAVLIVGIAGALVATRLNRAGLLEIEHSSAQFSESLATARLPLALRSDQNIDFAKSIAAAVAVVKARTAGDVKHYRTLLDRLPADIRVRELRQLALTSYWIAYRLLRDAETKQIPKEQQLELQSAIESLDFVIACSGEKTPAPILQLKASVLERQGKTALATELRDSIAPDERIATIPDRLLQAAELIRNNESRAAIAVLRKLTGDQPNITEAWLMMGRTFSQLKEFGQAEVCYSTCLELDTNNASGYFHRGVDYLFQRQFALAKRDFDAAIELDEQDSASYLNRALALKGMRELEPAIADLTAAIQLGAPETRAYYIRSQLLNELGRHEAAQQDLATFLELEPRDETSWLSRGLAQMKVNQPQRALADFESALKLNAISVDAFQNIATVQAEFLDQPEAAITAISRIIELHPDDLVSIVTRGVLYARLDQREKAHADAKTVLQKSSSADLLFRAAGIYSLTSCQQVEDASMAINLLNQAAFQDPGLVLSQISDDPDLEPVHDHEGFRALLEKLRSLAPPQPK